MIIFYSDDDFLVEIILIMMINDHEVGENYDNYDDDDDDYESAVSVHCIVHPADRGFVQ